MSREDHRERIGRYLDGLASPAEVELLGQDLAADPELARHLATMAWQESCLEKQFARQSGQDDTRATGLRSSGRHLRRRHVQWWTHSRLVAGLAAAALLVIGLVQGMRASTVPTPIVIAEASIMVSGGAVAVGAPPRLEGPFGSRELHEGVAICSGDRLIAAAQGIRLALVGEATELRVAPGSVVSFLSTTDGLRVHVDTGALRASVAKQPPGRQLRFITPFGDAVVVGTRLGIDVQSDRTLLRVFEGRVRLERPQAGEAVVVDSGFSAEAPALGRVHAASPIPPDQLECPVVWDARASGVKYFLSSAATWSAGHDPDGADFFSFQTTMPLTAAPNGGQEEYPWITLDREAQDWSAGSGLRVRVRGSGSGQAWVCEIYDDLPVERFVQSFIDDVPGWRDVYLPFSGFVRRASPMQHVHAPDDGLGLVRMHGLGLIAPPTAARMDLASIVVVQAP